MYIYIYIGSLFNGLSRNRIRIDLSRLTGVNLLGSLGLARLGLQNASVYINTIGVCIYA